MMETTLASDSFPRNVVLRMSQTDENWYVVRWQWRMRQHQVEAPSVEEAVREALQAIKALEAEGLV